VAEARVLGISDEALTLVRSAEVCDVSLELARQTRRNLDLVSRHLDPELYDTAEFIETVRALATSGRRARVRILVLDTVPVVKRGHRLIELAQRLSSFISIRVPAPEHQDFNEAWLVADDTGYCYRRFSDRYDASANFADRRYSKQLTQRFDELWNRAQPDANLRRLHL
jgi:hypothetical protein